jgi:hypothetical protein
MYRYLIFFILVTLLLSCGGKDPITTGENGQDRVLSNFYNNAIIFPDEAGGIFYDADISEILMGPGYYDSDLWGLFWRDGFWIPWSVAVALKEVDAITGNRRICYRFLGPDTNVMSIVFETEIVGNIRLPRVASCFILQPEGIYSQLPHYTFVEVSIVYQIWDDENGKWDIHLLRMGFDPDMFTQQDWSGIGKWSVDQEIEQGDFVSGYGQMMPDVAYDPRNEQFGPQYFNGRGDIYIVFTWYNDPPRVYYLMGLRQGINHWHYSEFFILPIDPLPPNYPEPIEVQQFPLNHGFHPRIDIGLVDLHSSPIVGERWNVMVAFTSDGGVGFFGPHFAFWEAGWLDIQHGVFPPITEMSARMEPYLSKAGFMPSVDIGPRGANHCAITWTQTRSENWNDVTIGYMDSHLGHFFMEGDGIMESFGFPSVAVWEDSGEAGHYRTSISYLNSVNPVTNKWDAMATTVDTHFLFPTPSLVTTVGVETDISLTVHGEYDSGSQYSDWYGMSSSMSAVDKRFWVLYSAIGDAGDNLTSVYGASGWTEMQ